MATRHPWLPFSQCLTQHSASDLAAIIPLRLFCFCHSGGGAVFFHSWIKALAPRIEVYPVELPGRFSRLGEEPFRRIEPLIAAASEALLPHLGSRFSFFGHSLGALVAFELSRKLRKMNRELPEHLFVSARRAPHLASLYRPICYLPENEFLMEFKRRYPALPQEVLADKDLLKMTLAILRADFEVFETYSYSPEEPLDCRITALGGMQDSLVDEQSLIEWKNQSKQNFELKMFPGDHFYLKTKEAAVVDCISAQMGNQRESGCVPKFLTL